jgi:UDP-N-acetylglucosamine/UDP-N-acetylgalactosamine 4-epimerase
MINIACGVRTSLNQLLSYIRELAGGLLDADYRPTRPGDVRDSLADVRAAKQLLGYEPSVDVREGLKRTFQAFKAVAT